MTTKPIKNFLRFLTLFHILFSIVYLSGCTKEGPTIQTLHGPVMGYHDEANTWVWKAVPFAKAPVGSLRWKAPQDPDPWVDVRQETAFGNDCVQYDYLSSKIMGDEDCLYLNVWRPQTLEADLPVYFWIHGGGNSVGSSANPDYWGANLASKSNMVVVSTNYRLGPFGWLTYPGLRSGLPDDTENDSGNYGTLDLIKALSWIKDNIKAFGGDPNLVTITGESAGGQNVLSLLMAPPAEGLFHRAMSQSGGVRFSLVSEGDEHAQALILKLLVNDGSAADEPSALAILNGMSSSEIQTYLRSKTSEEIMSLHERGPFGMISTLPRLFRDGTVLPEAGADAFSNGTYPNKVPTILGSNKEESKLFLFMDPTFWSKEELYQVVTSYSSDDWKASGVDQLARQLRSIPGQPNVYAYQFLWGAGGDTGESVLPAPWDFLLGSFHTLEIPFFFGNDTINIILQLFLFNEENEPGRKALTNAMMAYLAQFARTGDPNQSGSDLPEWHPWSNDEGGPKCILFDVDDEQAIDIKMSIVELTQAGIRERMAAEVPEPLYSEALEYLGW